MFLITNSLLLLRKQTLISNFHQNITDYLSYTNTNTFFLISTDKKRNIFHNIFSTFCFNCDSLHARLNSHYEAWSYKKKKHKKITAYRKSVQKESTVKRCLIILDLKPLRSQVKGKNSLGREFQGLAVQGKKL